MSGSLRDDPEAFDNLRDLTADAMQVSAGAVEKDYWATEALRAVLAPDPDVAQVVFKGGTSLAKAHQLIRRFSEDVDLIVVYRDGLTKKQRAETLRRISKTAADALAVDHSTTQGSGWINARLSYPVRATEPFASTGVLLEIGTRGGPLPNAVLPVQSFMGEVAANADATALDEFPDLRPFDVTVLSPVRTLAEKLAFLHDRATSNNVEALEKGGRHVYDAALLLENPDVRAQLQGGVIADLMVDIDERSVKAGFPYTPRPAAGFGASAAFEQATPVAEALRAGYELTAGVAWGVVPTRSKASRHDRRHPH